MPSIGPMEMIVVLVIALMVLGPKRLPDAGRSVGKGIREFKDAITGGGNEAEAKLGSLHSDRKEPHAAGRQEP
jgi:sec-independent protein translocase protein TatA